MLHVVENAAQKLSPAGPQRVNGVVDLRRRHQILTHYQQRSVGQVAEHLAVGEVAQGGRIDHHIVKALPGLGDDPGQKGGAEQVDHLRVGAAAQQHLHTGGGVHGGGAENLPGIGAGQQHVAEAAVFAQPYLQKIRLDRPAQIQVDKQHPAVGGGESQRGVYGHGGFALPLGHAGEQKHLFALGLLMLQPGGHVVDGFRKGEAGVRGGDPQILPPVLAGGGFDRVFGVLVGDGGDDPGVQIVLRARGALYRPPGQAQPDDGCGHQRGADQPGNAAVLGDVVGIVGDDGDVRRVQRVQHRRGGDIVGKTVVVVHDRLHDQQRVFGGVGGDGQSDQVGVVHLGRAQRAVGNAQILPDQLIHEAALQQLRIDVDHLSGGGGIGGIGRARGDGEDGAATV